MARKKKQESPGGIAGWYATFGDLMNLLLCFFVLLFSMSNIDAQKYEEVAASFSNTFGIFPGKGIETGDEVVIDETIQLDSPGEYFAGSGESAEGNESDAYEEMEREKLALSEAMADKIESALDANGIADDVELDFTSQYVLLTLNGALLFDSGQAEIREESLPLVNKIGDILLTYGDNIIEVEGHTDNVPIHNSKFKDNNVLSTFRALAVSEYLINEKHIEPQKLKYSGRGEYVPVADNDTISGRARNRRVEIKIYNILSD